MIDNVLMRGIGTLVALTTTLSLCLVATSYDVASADGAALDTTGKAGPSPRILSIPISTIPRPSPLDCDGNFIPDSLDIAEGFAVDSNHNGVPDTCEPDTTLLWSVASERWRDQDSVFFSSAYLRSQSVLVRYTVPKQAKVRIEIRSAKGDSIRVLCDGSRARGAYEEHWDRRGDDGRLVSAGAYEIRLTVGKQTKVSHVRWAAWP
jgi:flagellar hook capping protein FlgD